MAVLAWHIRRGGRANTPGKWANDRWDLLWVSPAIVKDVKVAPLFHVKFGVYGEYLPLPTDQDFTVADLRLIRSKVWGIPPTARSWLMAQGGVMLASAIEVLDQYSLRGGDRLEFHRG